MKALKRASGVLLHITCLPSDFGIGDLGPESYRFVDLLNQANQHYWSILPLTPTSVQYNSSPYQPTSAFAGNTLLISPELLFKDRLLSAQNIEELKVPFGRVDFKTVTAQKISMLKTAYWNFIKNHIDSSREKKHFEKFCLENQNWLDEYVLFKALRDSTCKPWFNWSRNIRDRGARVLGKKREELNEQIEQEKFAQFLFTKQWKQLKNYCNKKEVEIIGDLPFYLGYDSADVWSNPKLFKLNSSKKPLFVGGVPPDYFSSNGQRWGNPVYNWQEMKKTKFRWFIERFNRNLLMFDLLRLDHFRGFIAYWQIPACSKTAKEGKWIRTPSTSFFRILKGIFPRLPFIAEDLGVITDNVKKHLKDLELSGMRVLIFAFNGSNNNPHFPANIEENSVVYTGTHDTNTVQGWFVEEAKKEETYQFIKCVGQPVPKSQVSFEFIKLALTSKAYLSIIPLQDVLSLGADARMNNPAAQNQNWDWRVKKENLSIVNFQKLAELTENIGRC